MLKCMFILQSLIISFCFQSKSDSASQGDVIIIQSSSGRWAFRPAKVTPLPKWTTHSTLQLWSQETLGISTLWRCDQAAMMNENNVLWWEPDFKRLLNRFYCKYSQCIDHTAIHIWPVIFWHLWKLSFTHRLGVTACGDPSMNQPQVGLQLSRAEKVKAWGNTLDNVMVFNE